MASDGQSVRPSILYLVDNGEMCLIALIERLGADDSVVRGRGN